MNKHELHNANTTEDKSTLQIFSICNILRKTIEGYLDLFPSLTFNTIKTTLIIHAFHSSRYLQPK